jgi:hypothetical protein
MQNAQDAGSAEIWTAAQHRRTEDIADWVGASFKRRKKSPAPDMGWRRPGLRVTLMRGLAVATVAFVAVTSVSAVVHANKRPHLVLRPTAAMPAVNVP